MALELLGHYHKDIGELTLIPSDGGRFEVSKNGTLAFSKLTEGRFPEPKELMALIDGT